MSYGIVLNYQMRRWLVWNLGVSSNDKDSNLSGFANTRNVFSVGAQVGL